MSATVCCEVQDFNLNHFSEFYPQLLRLSGTVIPQNVHVVIVRYSTLQFNQTSVSVYSWCFIYSALQHSSDKTHKAWKHAPEWVKVLSLCSNNACKMTSYCCTMLLAIQMLQPTWHIKKKNRLLCGYGKASEQCQIIMWVRFQYI